MKVRWLLAALLLPVCLLLKGCGGDADGGGLNEDHKQPARAMRGKYHDWDAVELRNGLVSVHVVPGLGGRVLGYQFGERELLYVNPKLLGQLPGSPTVDRAPRAPATTAGDAPAEGPRPNRETTAPARDTTNRPPAVALPEAVRTVPMSNDASSDATPAADDEPGADTTTSPDAMPAAEELPGNQPLLADAGQPLRYIPSQASEGYRNYGGQVTWPGPQSHWSRVWPPPAGLDLGAYQTEVTSAEGEAVTVRLASETDQELQLDLSKAVTLHRASTVFEVRSALRNRGQVARAWSLSDVSQHPGALMPGETYTPEVKLYLPVNRDSTRHMGYQALLGPDLNDQVEPGEDLLTIQYQGIESMLATDSRAGWVAYADTRHDLVVAKVTEFATDGVWPERNLTTTAYTAPSLAESYVQMVLRSPLAQVDPDRELSLTVTYGVATCPAPVVAASRVGVTGERFVARRVGDTVEFSGLFGVFYLGHAQIVFYGADGTELARTSPVAVSPVTAYRLATVAPLPRTAVRAAVMLTNHQRVDVGILAEAPVADLPPASDTSLAAEPVTGPVPPVTVDGQIAPAAAGGFPPPTLPPVTAPAAPVAPKPATAAPALESEEPTADPAPGPDI